MNIVRKDMTEQRIHQRKDVRVQCKLVKDNIQSKITLVDISETGLGFITHEEYEVGQVIDVEFAPKDGAPMKLKLQVKNMVSNICANRIGVQLLDIPKAFLEFIQTFFHSAQNKFLKRFQSLSA